MYLSSLLSLLPLLAITSSPLVLGRENAVAESLERRVAEPESTSQRLTAREAHRRKIRRAFGRTSLISGAQPIVVGGGQFIRPAPIPIPPAFLVPPTVNASATQNLTLLAACPPPPICPPPVLLVNEGVPLILNNQNSFAVAAALAAAESSSSTTSSAETTTSTAESKGEATSATSTAESESEATSIAAAESVNAAGECPPQVLLVGEVAQALALAQVGVLQQQVVCLPPILVVNGVTQVLAYTTLPVGMSLENVAIPTAASTASEVAETSSATESEKAAKETAKETEKKAAKSKETQAANPEVATPSENE